MRDDWDVLCCTIAACNDRSVEPVQTQIGIDGEISGRLALLQKMPNCPPLVLPLIRADALESCSTVNEKTENHSTALKRQATRVAV